MVYAWRELFLVVGDHNECLVLTLAEGVDDVLHFGSVGQVESVQGLVKDEQFGVFDKGTCQEA